MTFLKYRAEFNRGYWVYNYADIGYTLFCLGILKNDEAYIDLVDNLVDKDILHEISKQQSSYYDQY